MESDPTGVYIYATDGSGATGEFIEGTFAAFDPEWTAAAVERPGTEDRDVDIWHVPLAAPDDARPLIATPAREFFGNVSPDGKWYLYRCDASGIDETFLTRFPSGEGKWQVSTGGASRSIWGPGSDKIYFVSSDDWVTEVALDTADGVRLGAPQRLFRANVQHLRYFHGWELPAPGDRFLGIGLSDRDEESVSIAIVEHWHEEFGAR